MRGLPSGQDGPTLRNCDKCGQNRRTTQVDPANSGPWLCAGCLLSYAPPRQSGNEAPASAPSQPRRGRRLSSLGQSTIGQTREHGESRGSLLSRTGMSASATTLGTLTTSINGSSTLQRAVTSGGTDSLTEFTRPLGGPLGARAKMRPRSEAATFSMTHSASETSSSSRSRPENHRGALTASSRSSETDLLQTTIPREIFKPKLASAIARTAAKAREAAREAAEEREREKQKREREREHRRRLEIDVEAPNPQPKVNERPERSEAVHEKVRSSLSPKQDKVLRLQCEELIGGFRRGDCVCSLVSRERRNTKVLEYGHNGEVISVQKPSSTTEDYPMLLVQFTLGFDWLLSPHQICPEAEYGIVSKHKLPGGYHWGDRVRILVDALANVQSMRGLTLGDTGTVIGPGHTQGKIAVRFDEDGGEWNIWPGALCLAEAYTVTFLTTIAGGFRRGDRVQTKASTAAKSAASISSLQAGDEGTVVGPGHITGRVLVKFDIGGQTWSMRPSQILSASTIVDLTETKVPSE